MINCAEGKPLVVQYGNESFVMIRVKMAHKYAINMNGLPPVEQVRILPFGKVAEHINRRAAVNQDTQITHFYQHAITLAHIKIKDLNAHAVAQIGFMHPSVRTGSYHSIKITFFGSNGYISTRLDFVDQLYSPVIDDPFIDRRPVGNGIQKFRKHSS